MKSCLHCEALIDENAFVCPQCDTEQTPPRPDLNPWVYYCIGVGIVIGMVIAVALEFSYDHTKIRWVNRAGQPIDPIPRWYGGLLAIVFILGLAGGMFGIALDWARQRWSDQRWRAKRKQMKTKG